MKRRRKLDIADVQGKRGVEVKSGYIRQNPEITSEIERDTWLIRERGWDIEYHFAPGSRASQGLLDAAKKTGIRVTGLEKQKGTRNKRGRRLRQESLGKEEAM